VVAELRALFPEGVAVARLRDFAAADPLHEDEHQHLRRALEKRRAEFRAGRSCARRALRELGVGQVAIARGDDRAPCWPAGIVGSISHARGYCAAVVGHASQFAGLGIDIECKNRVDRRLWKQIASADEIAWLEREADTQLSSTLLFSAKEAFYKAQYSISRSWLGFHAVQLRVERDSFEITLCRDIAGLAAAGARFAGRYQVEPEHVVTALAIPSLQG
jgi:4'-phosphopantetheinyl transferase EntD